MKPINTFLGVRKAPYGHGELITRGLGALPEGLIAHIKEHETSAYKLMDACKKGGGEHCLVVLEAPAKRKLTHPVHHAIINMRAELRRQFDPSHLDTVVIIDNRYSNSINPDGSRKTDGPQEIQDIAVQHGAWTIMINQHTKPEIIGRAFADILLSPDTAQRSVDLSAEAPRPAPRPWSLWNLLG